MTAGLVQNFYPATPTFDGVAPAASPLTLNVVTGALTTGTLRVTATIKRLLMPNHNDRT